MKGEFINIDGLTFHFFISFHQCDILKVKPFFDLLSYSP